MKTTLKLLLLACLLGAVVSVPVRAQSQTPVIQPEVDRRNIRIPKINVDDIEIGLYGGVLSVQDFGANSAAEFRAAYHLTEDFFIEGTVGRSTVSDESFRRLGIPIFTQQETNLDYYHLSVGYNLFPGEIFFGKNWAMTSAVYLIGGVGSVKFNNENSTSFNFGIGIRVLPADWLAVRVEMRDLLFESDILGKNELKHNFELVLGLGVYF
ncbi:MAG TPA: outer membrane beta-barrel domain-containing protein [Burkholderiales bacterium]|jgi:outer membrane beta-barrel protein